ncbi:hypothetical protein TNCV_2741381 [Trichonephila clavipes]|nr:hypothetical protein TNCV_2741381 [Trichonephila clavipes]
MEEDGETAEFLTDDDIAAAVTQEPMEEEGRDDETQCDKKDVVPHADGAAALALRYLEQQPDTTPADVLFMRRWRNYASWKRLSSLHHDLIEAESRTRQDSVEVEVLVLGSVDPSLKTSLYFHVSSSNNNCTGVASSGSDLYERLLGGTVLRLLTAYEFLLSRVGTPEARVPRIIDTADLNNCKISKRKF